MIRVKNLSKTYGSGENAVHALKSCNISFPDGSFTAIVRTSGSWKSTLLHLIGGLDTKADGEVSYGDVSISGLDDVKLSDFRLKNIGFVFQFFELVPELTAKENILLPVMLERKKPDTKYLSQLAKTLGISERLTHYPSQLSEVSSRG